MVRQQELSSTYKKLIISVILILMMIAGVVIYFSLNRVEITIFPKLITKQTQFFVDVKEGQANDLNANLLQGTIEKIEVEHSGTYDATGEKEVTAAGSLPVVGKVTLYNKQDSAQTLIKKTRVLSAENNLFRLNEAVSIPAGGSVEVDVYFDPEENNFMTQTASKFTVPGLGESLQSLVYAESSEPFVRPGNKVKFIQKSDIENAVKDLSSQKLEEIVSNLKIQYGGNNPVALAYLGEVLDQQSDKQEGDLGDKVTVTVKVRVVAVLLDNEIYSLIDKKLNDFVGDGYELKSLNFQNLKYVIDQYDLNANTASVEVLAEGNLILNTEHPLLAPMNFVGLDKEQLINYFQTMEDVRSTEIKFYPSWLKKVPAMVDHIYVTIQ
ncbi:MAG TPA: hypothetical protein PL066_03345 [bacterium]|nr:hypothetical protein [bacterium]